MSRSTIKRMMWKQWVNALLGLAVIATPFLGLPSSAMMWTLAVLGIAITGFSLWGASDTAEGEYEGRVSERRFQHQQ